VSKLRKTIKDALNVTNLSDMNGKWSNKKNTIKQNSIPEVVSKVQEIYQRYRQAFQNIDKEFVNILVSEVGLTSKESSYLLGDMKEEMDNDNNQFDMMVSTMGMDDTIFDELDSLKDKFPPFSNFKEEVKQYVDEWQDRIGDMVDEDGDFICNAMTYDEDSEEFVRDYLSGVTAEQEYQKILKACGLKHDYSQKTKRK
jgi:hypothetical protein